MVRRMVLPVLLAVLAAGALPAQRPGGHERMVRLLAELAERTPDEHLYFGTRTARRLRAELERRDGEAPWQLYRDLGLAEMRLGNLRASIDLLTTASRGLKDGTMEGGPQARMYVDFFLGFAYLRLGETENCCAEPVPESCILPILEPAVHEKREGSTKAAEHLLEVLEEIDEDEYWHMAARWLLNLAHMTLGTHPGEVPEEHLIPPESFAGDARIPRFRNIAQELGVDSFNLSGGAVVDDLDGDEDLDILTSTWDTRGPMHLFVNRGDGTFEERTEEAGLTGILGGLNLVPADYDNDGDLDVLVLRGAWLFETGRHPNSLLRNEGDATFTDVTFEAGLGEVHYPTQTADWGDYDLDGDLDLYIGNESTRRGRFPCQLFRNEGDGTFVDVAARAGVRNLGYAKGVSWGDYDGDRWPDLYVSNLLGANRLYRNEGDGSFTDVAPELGVTRPRASFPVWFWDFDNDGVLDLFVSSYNTGIGHLARWHLGRAVDIERPRLYRGDGEGGFESVGEECGLTYPSMPMGSNFGDLDNDGYLDFYLGTGDTNYYSVMPNLMFLNRGGREFADVTLAGGFGHLQKGHGVAFADLDHDGDQDVFEQMGGAYPGDAFHDALYENPGFGNHWLTVRLVGTRSNRSAIGARIRVEVVEDGERRSIFRHVNTGGSFGANPLRQTIGLGRAEEIAVLEVHWPVTDETQVFEGVAMDRAVRIVEGGEDVTVLDLAEVDLGG